MKPLIVILFLLTAVPCMAQHRFKVNNPSRTIIVDIDVAKCDLDCHGPAKFSFIRKGTATPFQIVTLPDTQMQLGQDGKPLANVNLLYDAQGALNFGDFNFDGLEDVAICDGHSGGYGAPTYRVYLYSPAAKQYVYSSAFSRLAHNEALGMFEIDKKKKMLMRFSKSGCCWHRTDGFAVVSGKPKKVYEFTEDASRGDDFVHITTRKLVNGKWRTQTKRAKISEYYKEN